MVKKDRFLLLPFAVFLIAILSITYALYLWNTRPHAAPHPNTQTSLVAVAPHQGSSGYNPDGSCPSPDPKIALSGLSAAALDRLGIPARPVLLAGESQTHFQARATWWDQATAPGSKWFHHRVCTGTPLRTVARPGVGHSAFPAGIFQSGSEGRTGVHVGANNLVQAAELWVSPVACLKPNLASLNEAAYNAAILGPLNGQMDIQAGAVQEQDNYISKTFSYFTVINGPYDQYPTVVYSFSCNVNLFAESTYDPYGKDVAFMHVATSDGLYTDWYNTDLGTCYCIMDASSTVGTWAGLTSPNFADESWDGAAWGIANGSHTTIAETPMNAAFILDSWYTGSALQAQVNGFWASGTLYGGTFHSVVYA